MTTRRPVRHRCQVPVTVVLAGGTLVTTTLLEVSDRGAFIEAVPGLDELQFGDRVELSFVSEDGNASGAKLVAVVARLGTAAKHVEHPSAPHVALHVSGFGLEFTATRNSDLLATLLEKADET